MSNFNWEDSSGFRDIPDEVDGNHSYAPNTMASNPIKSKQPEQATNNSLEFSDDGLQELEEVYYEEDSEVESTEEEIDFEKSLSDARLRLEKGKLYEMIMKHDIFEGVDADPIAVKQVQNEMRKFAKECMEVMLGMRAAVSKPYRTIQESEEPGNFNSLEVEVLKALASTATKGVTKKVETTKKQGLNSIGSKNRSQQSRPLRVNPKTPINRKISPDIDKILKQEGVSLEQLELDYKPLTTHPANMSPEEIVKMNARNSNRKKQAKSDMAIPMPSDSEFERILASRIQERSDVNSFVQLVMNAKEKSKQ